MSTPARRFIGGLESVRIGQECAAGLAEIRARGLAGRQQSAPTSTRRPRSTTDETRAQQIYADAWRLYQDGQYAQARMKFLRLVGGASLADEGHYGLACIAERSGDAVTKRSHLVRVAALNPRHRYAVKALERMRRVAPGSN